MAREIVITSVPRGVRPGRTGFQVAMRTAGLGDEVCDQLESLGVYRHLPAGSGPNPVCYFHRFVQTGIGPLQVLGRVTDAGADYSSRSNKLAHLIAIEAAELAILRHSSPAAVLASVEGRLARTWPGGPEERQQPFGLTGIPAVGPGICAAWRQAAGDAGWGGVLAEQAVRNKPVLVIAPNASPEWCRRLLDLFAEALALVPEERRWSVTFDTTVLSNAPVLWRGTYAGSPESRGRQPGLMVVDLAQRAPVPAELAGSTLVSLARSGAPAPTVTGPRVPVLPGSGPEKGPPIPTPIDQGSILSTKPASRIPSVPGRGQSNAGRVPEPEPSSEWQAKVAWVVVAIGLLIAVSVGVFYVLGVPSIIKEGNARSLVKAWADQDDGKKPPRAPEPTIDTWLTMFGEADPKAKGDSVTGLNRQEVEGALPLLNSALLTKSVNQDAVSTSEKVQSLVRQLQNLRGGNLNADELAAIGVRLQAAEKPADELIVAWVNELVREGRLKADQDQPIQEVQRWVDLLRPLASVVSHPADAAQRPRVSPQAVQSPLEFLITDSDARKRMPEFTQAIADNPGLVSGVKTIAELRAKLNAMPAGQVVAKAGRPGAAVPAEGVGANEGQREDARGGQQAQSGTDEQAKQQAAWADFVKQVESGIDASNKEPREWPIAGAKVPLVRNISNVADLDWENLRVILGGVGKAWQPTAVQESGNKREWSLKGLPGGSADTCWGKIVFDEAPSGSKFVFIPQPDAPWICGFVPIAFEWTKAPAESRFTNPLAVAGRPQALQWKAGGAETWGELAGMVKAGGGADSGGDQLPPARKGTLGIRPEPWLGACVPHLIITATSPDGKSLQVTAHDDKPATGTQSNSGTIDLVFRSEDLNLKETHPLVERFRWSVSTGCEASFAPVADGSWADRPDVEVKTKEFTSMKSDRWREIVSSVLTAHLDGNTMKSLPPDEVGKRIGTKEINRLTHLEREFKLHEANIQQFNKQIWEANQKKDEQAKAAAEASHGQLKKKTPGYRKALDKDRAEVTDYSPWSKHPPTKDQSLAEWKRMAVEYVAVADRGFAKFAAAQGRDAEGIKRMAQDPAIVARFLDAQSAWVTKVTASFLDKKLKSKAEQNELLALLVLAHVDGMIVKQTAPDGARLAFGAPISECIRGTLEVSWTVDGQKDPVRVPVATVYGTRSEP